MKNGVIAFFFLAGMLPTVLAAQPTIFFRKITVEDGLNDGAVQAIARDKKGFMWISTIGGLNRYDGTGFTFFDKVESASGSVPLTICRSMASDAGGRFFFGFENGLGEFDFAKRVIRMAPALQDIWVLSIQPVNDSILLLRTYDGWMRYNPITGRVLAYSQDTTLALLHDRRRAWCYKSGILYIANGARIFAFDPLLHKIGELPLPSAPGLENITNMAMDGDDNLWMVESGRSRVVRYHMPSGKWKVLEKLIPSGDFGIGDIFSHPDQKTVWIATGAYGSVQYLPERDDVLFHRHDPLHPWTPNANLVRCVHIDDDGTVWLGGDYGVNITDPGRALFEIIPPFRTDITDRNRRIARAASEDDQGGLWFGTFDGVVYHNRATGVTKEYNNRPGKKDVIYFNSVRGVVAEGPDHVWIATGRGINRLHKASGKMDHFTEKDSVSTGFYFGACPDRQGNIWFPCRDGSGLYYFSKEQQKFNSIATHPHLRRFTGTGCRYVYEDSRGRYWIGFNGAGLAMYDPRTERTETWNSVPGKNGAISGNYVVDIKEDKDGKLWVSTFSGLTCIDAASMAIQNYTTANGLLSNTVSSLGIDSLNRVWIGTARGLMMLDADRKLFTSFGLADGLPSIAFPEHPGLVTRNGDFIMPTLNGYVRFDPEAFVPRRSKLPCYISGLQIAGEPKTFVPDEGATLKLPYFRNSITIHLVGINYTNPAQTWYAYRLEGFDKKWHYTQDPKVVYTNLPGGSYRFEYKAGTNAYEWDTDATILPIRIGTVFYKTAWFILLAAILLAGLLYWVYRLRLARQEHLFELQSRTQALEKEKAMVMYENLKQHLNPHFLFNSLTSLSSLIRIDQQMAGDFLDRMSKIYRYILKNRDSETVTLQDELNFVSNFIELQKTRFESGLQVKVDVAEEHLYKKLAPVTLQNLVENAIKHNTTSKHKPLIIDVFVEDEYLVVRNNLQRKAFVETSNRTGLESMKDLYRYLSARPMMVEEDERFFKVKVPLG
ncbi:MAG TPA: two-component regulator propeller domain-containing protein [Phnomibacter sp.]|nr:two-component regulator propeller domain-containing protein [Phnomibacter sp.]